MTYRNVSIVMCTYNGEQFIRQQLDSIINQSYPVYELIVQDDCSTDGTTDIVKEYATRYSFIKLHINERNLGYNHNFLAALLRATGDAIAIADQDDIWHTDKIKKQIGKLNEGYSFVFHNSLLFEDNISQPITRRHKDIPVISELRLIMKPFIPGHECLFTKEALPLVNQLYLQENKLAYAYIIAIACSTLGNICYLNEDLVYWRRHAGAATHITRKKADGATAGMIHSLRSLFDKEKKSIPARYFKAISILEFKSPVAKRVVKQMQGSTADICKACIACGTHTDMFFKKKSIRNRIKALFTPLHLIREGRFLIK